MDPSEVKEVAERTNAKSHVPVPPPDPSAGRAPVTPTKQKGHQRDEEEDEEVEKDEQNGDDKNQEDSKEQVKSDAQTPDDKHGELHFAEYNRPAASRLQKGMEIEADLVPHQRDCVRALRKYTTLTNAEIFRRVGISTSNGYRYLRNKNNDLDSDGVEKLKPKMGRKRKLDDLVVGQVVQLMESQPAGEKTKTWGELCKHASERAGVDLSPVTLRRAVENAGYHKCPSCQRGEYRAIAPEK
jgi:transposase